MHIPVTREFSLGLRGTKKVIEKTGYIQEITEQKFDYAGIFKNTPENTENTENTKNSQHNIQHNIQHRESRFYKNTAIVSLGDAWEAEIYRKQKPQNRKKHPVHYAGTKIRSHLRRILPN